MKSLVEVDRAILFAVNQAGRPAWDPIAILISSEGLWWIVAGLIAIWIIARRDLRWLQMGIAMLLALGISDLVTARVYKPFFNRLRPCYQFYQETRHPISGCGSLNGMPSNHASNAMASATVVLVHAPLPVGIFALCVAGLVGLSRVYLGVHFPGDVLVGFCGGALIGLAVGWATRRPWKSFRRILFT